MPPSSDEGEGGGGPRKLRRAASRVIRTLSALRGMKAAAAAAAAARSPEAAPAVPLARDATATARRGWGAKRRVGALPPAVEGERGGGARSDAAESSEDDGEGAPTTADAVRLGFGSPPGAGL